MLQNDNTIIDLDQANEDFKVNDQCLDIAVNYHKISSSQLSRGIQLRRRNQVTLCHSSLHHHLDENSLPVQ